ncbi:MAG: GntR family transcriptional regulator [Oscillospiraceae bacterium]|jgi:DNA-binding transcriptional regulator YhcF (GntR family)|nr:GntR family transcriptional regulator [Oscillospiraceae bacterium]
MDNAFDAQRPIYIQLIERVKTRIVSGEYPPGEQIPPVRELADASGVNPNTMQKALAELERDGLLTVQRTVGRFVTGDEDLIAKLKAELAQTHIARFLREITALGIDAGDAIRLLTDYIGRQKEEI